MKSKITIIRVLILAVVTLFIILPAVAKENVTDPQNRSFYNQLSCKASDRAVIALAASLENKGVSRLEINKAIIEALQGTSLNPNAPRWRCCEACVENNLPNDSTTRQCCDG